MRFEERRGGESYRPSNRYSRSRSRSRVRRPRSPPPPPLPRNRSPRIGADTWAPRGGYPSERYRSRSPAGFHRSRSPSYRQPQRARSPLRPRSPRRDRPRSPIRLSWRSRSPYNRQRLPLEHQSSRDNFRSSHIPRSPRRDRQPSPPPDRYRDTSSPSRPAFKERDSYGRRPARSRSPHRDGRDSFQHRRMLSPVKRTPSGPTSAFNSASTSRRSSPPTTHERLCVPSSGPRSRSPTVNTLTRRATNDDVAKTSALSSTVSPLSPAPGVPINSSNAIERQASTELPERTATDVSRPGSSKSPRSHSDGFLIADRDDGAKDRVSSASRNSQEATLPTAPSATSISTSSSSSQNRPSNISLLSAPTRPRGAASYTGRDPAWSGSSTTPRRALPPTQHAPPTGPRNRYAYNSPPVQELHRAPSYRHNSVSLNHPRTTRINHLATLSTVIPGGRLLPFAFDFSIEKRLMSLKADEEKLAEQVLEKQQLKRAGLRDWGRLQRESALNALRSDLAEVHLQRMTEEDRLEGSSAF